MTNWARAVAVSVLMCQGAVGTVLAAEGPDVEPATEVSDLNSGVVVYDVHRGKFVCGTREKPQYRPTATVPAGKTVTFRLTNLNGLFYEAQVQSQVEGKEPLPGPFAQVFGTTESSPAATDGKVTPDKPTLGMTGLVADDRIEPFLKGIGDLRARTEYLKRYRNASATLQGLVRSAVGSISVNQMKARTARVFVTESDTALTWEYILKYWQDTDNLRGMLQNQYADLQNADTVDQPTKGELEKLWNGAKGGFGKIERPDQNTALWAFADAERLYQKIADSQSDFGSGPQIRADGYSIRYVIALKKRNDPDVPVGVKDRTLDAVVTVKQHLPYFFSTSFILNELQDESYHLRKVGEANQIRTDKTGSSHIDTGVMAHFQPFPNAPWFALSGGLVPGSKWRYLYGGSIVLGETTRLVASGGWVRGDVTRLAVDDDQVDNFVGEQIPTTTMSVEKWFVAIGVRF